MHPQLAAIVASFEDATERLRDLNIRSLDEHWNARPPGGGWSAAECIAHLNLTSAAYLQLLPPAIEQARTVSEPAPSRFRRDVIGWLIWKASGPSGRGKTRTTPAFVPGAVRPTGELLTEFGELQVAQIDLVRAADGLPLHRVRVASPFSERVRYSLYSALTILPAHQHRHLHQAERALQAAAGE